MPELKIDSPDHVPVWHIDYKPEPWAWVDWKWATDGRFGGRWDDRDGNFRTIYAGAELLGCLLEVLADFRPDQAVATVIDEIDEDVEDAAVYPTATAGELDPTWLDVRTIGTGRLTGQCCSVTAIDTVAALRPVFVAMALDIGFADFDAAALKDRRARPLTQSIATHLYATTSLDGVRFASRHGDDQVLWAVFERADDPLVTPRVTMRGQTPLTMDHPDVTTALETLGLAWAQ